MQKPTKKHVLRLSGRKHEGHPVCVRGAFEVWLDSDVDEWSVKTMSHSRPAPPFTQERDSLCVVCMCGEKGTYLCMSPCLRGRAPPCTRATECVLFWQPSVTHVNDTAQTLHESAVWVQGVSEMAKSTGLNTLTPAQPWEAPHYCDGETHDPFPFQTWGPRVPTQLKKHMAAIHTMHIRYPKWAWVNKMFSLFPLNHRMTPCIC